MSNESTIYRLVKPEESLSDYVYCFSALKRITSLDNGIIIPNGRVDLIFTITTDQQLRIGLLGLENQPKKVNINVSAFFAVNFNPLAVEYILKDSIANIRNSGKEMPHDFWDFTFEDLKDFDAFCEKATHKIQTLLPEKIDERKQKLFQLIFRSNGEILIKELAERVHWSERQINRYFNRQFGLSLKTYCSILRFQASLPSIKEGELYPQLNFTDQSHFIKEIKKYSGVSPKELYKNENDRFLQFLSYAKR
ncbi:transcriptional regulator [Arachidicoccus ginsenosidimutans]|uniref:helix-turn-helix domain-containing protein n=1 Tax=Arachidicoccus sp. BS20 TaxID=1850526 RepID=UPI0007F0D5ED|nr:AraC family transcriptional regulator [Arachidicoccus sp. BS20]ANI89771.1 transcriptional regulator [Arachidicoccus sp. BS20]